jgi:hypothetical protein
MELSPQQRTRYDRIRATFNGPLTVGYLQENRGEAFSVSLHELPEKFRQIYLETDATELRTVLAGGLSAGWQFDAASDSLTFTQPTVQMPPAPAIAPGLSAEEAGKALTPADRAAIRWNQDREIQRRYPSVVQYQQAVAMGLA